MAHTDHTTTNQIRQPTAMIVRSIETSFVSVLWANARMRKTYAKGSRESGLFSKARRCAEFGNWIKRVSTSNEHSCGRQSFVAPMVMREEAILV
jgi:hypothetical protein